jgi:hypothetical protein
MHLRGASAIRVRAAGGLSSTAFAGASDAAHRPVDQEASAHRLPAARWNASLPGRTGPARSNQQVACGALWSRATAKHGKSIVRMTGAPVQSGRPAGWVCAAVGAGSKTGLNPRVTRHLVRIVSAALLGYARNAHPNNNRRMDRANPSYGWRASSNNLSSRGGDIGSDCGRMPVAAPIALAIAAMVGTTGTSPTPRNP